jgi:hypothetical protein
MNGALVQSKIWRGYEKAACKIGSEFQFHRPRAGGLTLEAGGALKLEGGGDLLLEGSPNYPGIPLFTRYVSLNAEDMKYGKPQKYGKATWYALFDGHGICVGDYFIGLSVGGDLLLEGGGKLSEEGEGNFRLQGKTLNTFFVVAMQPLLPILVVECNRVISMARPKPQSGSGAQPYSGMTTANEIKYAIGVPCSILQGTKGEKNETALAGDTRTPWWTVLLPASVGAVEYGDLIIDDLNNRYVVSSAESTALGWRLNVAMAVP